MGEIGFRKDVSSLVEQHALVVVSGAVVTQEQSPYGGIAGHECSLCCCAVIVLLGFTLLVGVVCALMVEQVDPSDSLCQFGQVSRIRAIGIRTGLFCRNDEVAVGYDSAIGACPVGSQLDVVDLTDRNLQIVDHVATDVRQRGLLSEEEATARNTVVEGQRADTDTLVVVDNRFALCIDGMEHHIIFQLVAKQLLLHLQQGFECLMGINMKRCGTAQHTKGAHHADKPQAVVAVEMRDKDGLNLHEVDASLAQLQLRSLTAIHHKLLVPERYHLRRGVVVHRWHGAPTT